MQMHKPYPTALQIPGIRSRTIVQKQDGGSAWSGVIFIVNLTRVKLVGI